jgi:hypothetical protein
MDTMIYDMILKFTNTNNLSKLKEVSRKVTNKELV